MAKSKVSTKKAVKKPAKKVAAKKPVKKMAVPAKKIKKSAVKKVAPKATAKKTPVKAVTKTASKSQKTDLKNLMTPLDDRIVVEPIGQADRTPGGLFIPDTVVMERKNQGMVLAVGRGHMSKKGHLRPLDVKVGDQILFESFAGDKIQVVGQELVILRESEVLGILS